MKKIPSIIVPIVHNNESINKNLYEFLKNKKVIIFGVPGAFTPTCSEKHLPSYLKLGDQIKEKGINDIFCLSVNDRFVMQSWLISYADGYKIKGIADGNAEITKSLGLISDKSSNFMGLRCTRFAMIVDNNNITNTFIEEPGKLEKTSANNIIEHI